MIFLLELSVLSTPMLMANMHFTASFVRLTSRQTLHDSRRDVVEAGGEELDDFQCIKSLVLPPVCLTQPIRDYPFSFNNTTKPFLYIEND